jgi:hypothetical protein
VAKASPWLTGSGLKRSVNSHGQHQRLKRVFEILLAVALLATIPVQAQFTTNTSEIQAIISEAQSSAELAITKRRQASEFRELALSAGNNAETASDPTDASRWRLDAIEYENRAEDLETEASNLDEQRARLLEQAGQLQAAEDERRRAEERLNALSQLREYELDPLDLDEDRPKLTVGEFLGIWEDESTVETIAIVPAHPGDPSRIYELELHTNNRIWSGWYTSFEEGAIQRLQEARVEVSHLPSPEEMNPEIPEWARSEVENELQWKVRLDESGSCGAPALVGKFLPGEVNWEGADNSGSERAWVSGDGHPREFSLRKKHELNPSFGSAARIRIRNPGSENHKTTSLPYVIKAQQVLIEAFIPREQAEELGRETEIKMEARYSGNTYRLPIKTPGMGDIPTIIYSHDGAQGIAFGDSEDIALYGKFNTNFLSLNSGFVMDFDVENGEWVDLRIAGAQASIQVFDNEILASIHFKERALEKLRVLLSTESRSADQEERRNLQRKLQMVRNAQELMAAKEKLMPTQILAVGEWYLGALARNLTNGMKYLHGPFGDEYVFRWYQETVSEDQRVATLSPHVLWTSEFERNGVSHKVNVSKPDMLQVAMDMLTAIAKSMHYIVTNFPGTCTDGVYRTVTGRDILGQEIDSADRMLSGLELLECIGPFAMASLDSINDFRRFRPGGQVELGGGARSRLGPTVVRNENRSIGPRTAGIPRTVRPRQAQAAGIPVRQPSTEPRMAVAGSDGGSCRTPGAIDHYGPNARIKEATDEKASFRQVMPNTCAERSIAYDHFEAKGVEYKEWENLGDMRIRKIWTPYPDSRRVPASVGVDVDQDGWVLGMTWEQSARLIELRGGRVVKRPGVEYTGSHMSLDSMDKILKQGSSVNNMINVTGRSGRRGRHVVSLRAVNRNTNGEIISVDIFDPAVGAIVEVPACDYLNLLVKPPYRNSQVYRWADGVSARPSAAKSVRKPPAPRDQKPGISTRKDFVPSRGKLLGDIVDDMYQGRGVPADRIHVTSLENLQGIRSSGTFQPSDSFGPTWGLGGRVSTSSTTGNIAIRVNPDHPDVDKYITWRRDPENRGWASDYWPSGEPRTGPRRTYIPARYLQYLEPGSAPGQEEWINVVPNSP